MAVPPGLRIEGRGGDFASILGAPDVIWAFGNDPYTSVPHNDNYLRLICLDPQNVILGILTYLLDGGCKWEWIKTNPQTEGQGVAEQLVDEFVSRIGHYRISCRLICQGVARTKIERLLKRHRFEQDGSDPDDWTRWPKL